MSKNDGKKGTLGDPREDISGTAGLERTVGTTSTSTGTPERTGVTTGMSDTGNLDHSNTSQTDHQHFQVTSDLANYSGAAGSTTIPSNK
ncbi:unnamed protein product [Rotaria sordida]|uniref:Uncharacterized protein n=1 Tax=Rotaria sordida TaxID=392033 RepID=A0A814PB74_9BILA|nr:unnamed protein product [Rotaria sordida]